MKTTLLSRAHAVRVWRFRRLAVVLVTAAIVGGIASAQNTPSAKKDRVDELSVSVCGLRIVAPAKEKDSDLRAFNWMPGTTVALLIESPKAPLIAFDEGAGRIERFVDAKGKSLRVKDSHGQTGFGPFPTIAKHGKAAIIEIQGGKVPTVGSAEIQLKGEIVFISANAKKAFKNEKVALKKGVKIEAGDLKFTISKVGKPDWGDQPLQIELSTKGSEAALAGVRFLDTQGKEIESNEAGREEMTLGNAKTITRAYNLAKKIESATIEITSWMDMKTVKVPFDLKVTAGL